MVRREWNSRRYRGEVLPRACGDRTTRALRQELKPIK
jgi:hypothetical protein